MAEYEQYLATLDFDPGDEQALAALEGLGNGELSTPEAAQALASARKTLRERGALEVVARLFDLEIKAVDDDGRRADLLLEKGHLYADDLLNEQSAVACFKQVLDLRPNDEDAQEVLAHLDLVRDNWKKIVDKYIDEAKNSTDRQLTTSLYLSAAETYARYEPSASEVEQYLREALEVEPRNKRAATHLERLLRKEGRWEELSALLEQRVDAAATKEDRVQALLALADLAKSRLDKPELAVESMKKLIAHDPAHPRALQMLADLYEKEENWSALVMLYSNALKARRRSVGREPDTGMLLQIAMLHWKRLDNADAAEEYFRRIRKAEPAHRAALDFYREYSTARGEQSKLVQILRQALKAVDSEDERRALAVEIATLSETELGNPDKAIDSWKGILRRDPDNQEARDALKRLYRSTEKWNALLDLMKDEIERLPADDAEGRIQRLLAIVEIYRDRLKLDVMVINTYNSILQIDPDNVDALDALAAKYNELGRWNDLITVWTRKAGLESTSRSERAALLRDIAGLWADRFGNYAQAVKPLEELLEIAPDDRDAITRLKEIYTRRRQWRALIALMDREVDYVAPEERRAHLMDMARLASDRLGDPALAIGVWNRVLEIDAADAEALASLASLYERSKRWLPLAEVYHRQRAACGEEDTGRAVAILERLGALYADKLDAPAQAVDPLREILDLDPHHAKALRTLREIYVQTRDAKSLEKLYGKLNQWDELVDVMSAMADRESDRKKQLKLLARTAKLAADHLSNADKIARAYERVQAVDPKHAGAAAALVGIYEKTHKWARLLSAYEVLLEHADDVDEKLRLHLEIRKLAEERLGSKALAFQWTAKAFELKPGDPQLLDDLERLGAEADAWEEVAAVLDRRATTEGVSDQERLRLYRQLGTIASVRLHRPDDARRYHEAVLELAPDDPQAMAALERLHMEQSRWPDLLGIYRRRAELAESDSDRLALLFKIAFIEEERVGDLDAAASTYKHILDIDSRSQRALKALAKVQETRGDSGGLAAALERELALASEPDTKVGLLLRLGALYEEKLGRRADALEGYTQALGLAPNKPQVHAALERFLVASSDEDEQSRVYVAGLLLPIYEQTDEPANIARTVEILRAASDSADQRLAYDRRLVRIYGQRLADHQKAYEVGLRVLDASPGDGDNRRLMFEHGAAIDGLEDLALQLDRVLEEADDRGLDASTRRAIAAEIAGVYDERLAQPERAETAWRRVLDIDPSYGPGYDALDRIYRGTEQWAELRELLLKREQNVLDANQRKSILLSICDLDEGVLDNVDGAIDTYQRVLELDPTLTRAYKALERLYTDKEAWSELEEILGRELEHVDPNDESVRMQRVALMHRRAMLRAKCLDDVEGAVDLLEEVVRVAPGHTDGRELLEELLPGSEQRQRVARILEPLYAQDGLWRDLCIVLRAQREAAPTPHDEVDLLARVAKIEEENLGHERAAFETWMDALRIVPADERPRAAVKRFAPVFDRWGDAAQAWEDAIANTDETDLALRAELIGELAAIYDRELSDSERAISAYCRLLEVDPTNPDVARPAAEALDRLYAAAQKWPELIDIVRRQADWADSTEQRKGLLARVAHINEEQLDDIDGAVATWRDVLTDDPEDAAALDALERIYTARSAAPELIDILRRRVDIADDGAEKKRLLRRIAELYERSVEDLHEAIVAHLEVLDHIPDDRETLNELARLYRTSERYTDLLEVTERRLALAEDPLERVELTTELGDLLHRHLEREAEALERFAEVLRQNPAHVTALSAVEGMLEDEDLRVRASEVLLPIYEAGSEHLKLASLLQRVADTVQDPRERVRCLRRVAEIRERDLDDRAAAFDAYKALITDALAEPELPELIQELERLAADQGRMEELIAIYRDIAPDVLDAELQRRLYLDIADLSRAVLKDDAAAREYYQRVIDAQPDDQRAMAALEVLYRDAGEHEHLYEILHRKAELHAEDLDVRAATLIESARLCTEQLDRPDDAIMHWEQVLEIAPENQDAAKALEGLYERAERWHELADLLNRRLGFAFSVPEAVAIQFRLARIYEKELHDPDTAVESYAATLGGDPNHEGATKALESFLDDPGTRTAAAEVLEPVYVSHQDWPNLIKIYDIKLDAAEDPAERLRLTGYIARLYEEQLEDLDEAFKWYGRVFREDPSNAAIRDQLARLATILENWTDYANIYQEYLDDESGDSEDVRTAALALAEVYDRRLDEVERGQAAYRRALQSRPDDHATFEKLEAMLTRAERWYALVDAYEEAIGATLDDDRRKDLYARMARVQEQHLQDVDRAVDAYRAILDIDPGDRGALDELDRLYQEGGKWFDLSELLAGRIERSEDKREISELRLRLGQLTETRLDDVNGAIDFYEQVLEGGPYGQDSALAALERLVQQEQYQERIAALLEPVYRHNDWWQKLVVLLHDARLPYVDDQEARVAMLREIAHIHESRGGDERLALKALARAWKEDIGNEEVYAELAALAAKLGAWDELVNTLEEGIEGNYDYELVGRMLARIAELQETRRGDNSLAIDAWRRLLEVRDEDAASLASLDRLLAIENRNDERVKIIERRAELADDDDARKDFLYRIAALQEEELDSVPDAITTWRSVLSVDDADSTALDALERLYRATGDFNELSMILGRKIEVAEDPSARRGLRFAAATVADDHLNDPYEAINHLRSILEDEPGDTEALARLDALYEREKMWPELLDVIDRRAELESEQRAELGYRAAHLVEQELMEAEAAIERYAAVLELEPSHSQARAALDRLTGDEQTLTAAADVLERLYRAEGAHGALADLYERRIAAAGIDPGERLAHFAALAEVHELSRSDLDAAFGVWARALVEAPEDEHVQQQLDRLAAARGAWQELASLYERRCEEIMDGELEYAYAIKVAHVYEDALGDMDKAAEAFRKALSVANDERPALAALDRIYERTARWKDLADVLAREADVTLDEAEQAEYLYRLGDVRERQLADASGAVMAYRDVLERAPDHGAARAALERLLSSDAERSEIIAVLEPIYEADGDFARLADLLGAKLGITSDSLDRAQLYARIAEISEQRLSDPTRALDATGGWLAEDPHSAEALAELERLAEQVQRWGEVAARLSGIVSSTDSPDVRQLLSLRLGQIQLERLDDAAAAEHTFRGVLETERDNEDALRSLERIYRKTGEESQLSEILARRGELALDAQDKRELFVEVAQLRAKLGDMATAESAWKEVLDLDEGDREAHGHLAHIFETQERWHELIDILGVAARFARDRGEEHTFRARIAQIHTDTLGELEEAVDAWQAVVDLDPTDLGALTALEGVHARREDWLAVQEVLTRRLDSAESNADRVEIFRRLADVAENKRESVDEAIGHLHQILDIDNADMTAYAELERLLTKAERWHDLVEVLQRVAEVVGTLGDTDKEIGYLARAADVWEGPLENPDAAGEILEQILRREPNYVPAFNRLARIYEAHAEWEKCSEILQRALALGPTGTDAADLYFRLGAVARNQNDDVEQAAAYFGEALKHDHNHAQTVSAVEEIARNNEDWPVLVDMLARRQQTEQDPAQRLEITLELAEIYRTKLNQPDAVIPLLEQASQTDPDDPRVAGPLADLYFAAGRHQDALPVYERLAEAAKAKRRMKDVAKYRQRIGGIAEATGQMDVALASYEEAFRVNPTDVPTMAGLGRIYMQQQDWEKARRVYRSMVLQNIDPDVGISKAEVYAALGNIHVQLGEDAKAKNMYRRGLELDPDNAALKQALDALG